MAGPNQPFGIHACPRACRYRKLLLLDDGREVAYEKCLLATGGTPKNLPEFEDKSLSDNVVLFRTVTPPPFHPKLHPYQPPCVTLSLLPFSGF